MKRWIPVILSLSAMSLHLDARTVKTTRRTSRQHSQAAISTPSVVAVDTLIPSAGDAVISGYDKPLRSSSETFFMTNNTPLTIVGAVVTTVYYDTDNRQLHRSTRHVTVNISPGETSMATVPTWDRQRSFYYIGSRAPRTPAIPYDISQRVDTLFILHPETSAEDGSSD